ncbi:MAG: LysM peptidoglycan-binding domain-containing protein [Candidatus Limnocylindrales bacterium]|jgi:hypothetical protein
MNENAMNKLDPSDEEILSGVRRRLSSVETLVPRQGPWDAAMTPAGRPVRTVVRPGIGFAGLAPLVVVAALVVVAVGYGLSSRSSSPAALSIGKTPSGPAYVITYRLVPPNGGLPSTADLEQTVRMLALRLASIFPVAVLPASSPAASGPLMPDLSQAEGYSVTAQVPDEIVVRYESDYRMDEGSFVWDADTIRASLGMTGRIELVDLPAAVYGTSGTPGPRDVPQIGAAIDPTLPALLSRSDLTMGYGISSDFVNPDVITLRFDFTDAGARTMADYSQANTGHYLALTLDGVVAGTTVMAGQGRYGTLQMTTVPLRQVMLLAWLFEEGNAPLPVPLTEVAFASVAPPGWVAPTGPQATPTPILPPTPVSDLVPSPMSSGWIPPLQPTPVIPTPQPSATVVVYVVRPGDTLSAIANRFNVSLASLEAANPKIDPAGILSVGTILNIPAP